MNSKFKCGGCRRYLPIDQLHRTVGLNRVCSPTCAVTVVSRSRGSSPPRAALGDGRKHNDVPTAVREVVAERDRRRCRWCGAPLAELHHINYRSQGVDHSPHNLISLCDEHHRWAHSNKRKWQPVLRAVMWVEYVQRQHVTVPTMMRRLGVPG